MKALQGIFADLSVKAAQGGGWGFRVGEKRPGRARLAFVIQGGVLTGALAVLIHTGFGLLIAAVRPARPH